MKPCAPHHCVALGGHPWKQANGTNKRARTHTHTHTHPHTPTPTHTCSLRPRRGANVRSQLMPLRCTAPAPSASPAADEDAPSPPPSPPPAMPEEEAPWGWCVAPKPRAACERACVCMCECTAENKFSLLPCITVAHGTAWQREASMHQRVCGGAGLYSRLLRCFDLSNMNWMGGRVLLARSAKFGPHSTTNLKENAWKRHSFMSHLSIATFVHVTPHHYLSFISLPLVHITPHHWHLFISLPLIHITSHHFHEGVGLDLGKQSTKLTR
eukprot:1157219-Pelagomonas_calceolata.AAC.3